MVKEKNEYNGALMQMAILSFRTPNFLIWTNYGQILIIFKIVF